MDRLLVDHIYQGDLLEVMRTLPDGCVDLGFADPPYNLEKTYGKYEDGLESCKYIAWCNEWLAGYIRLLKPTGSLFVINLPKWCIYHAEFLSRHLFFRHWIAWDALSEPRGRIMPAHYGILYYTKSAEEYTFNGDVRVYPPDFCFRAKCVRDRQPTWDHTMRPLSDIWWDIHRIKHKRDRDAHPCQLPVKLLERIITMASRPGDVVFDGFAGTGSTLTAAKKLGRRYIGVEIDPDYIKIANRKLQQMLLPGL